MSNGNESLFKLFQALWNFRVFGGSVRCFWPWPSFCSLLELSRFGLSQGGLRIAPGTRDLGAFLIILTNQSAQNVRLRNRFIRFRLFCSHYAIDFHYSSLFFRPEIHRFSDFKSLKFRELAVSYRDFLLEIWIEFGIFWNQRFSKKLSFFNLKVINL